MNQIDKEELENFIRNGKERFSYQIEPILIAKIQLFLTGKITKGIELFGIRPVEIRAFGFLIDYSKEINYAIENHYRVFVKKEGKYFSKGNWLLKFIKK